MSLRRAGRRRRFGRSGSRLQRGYAPMTNYSGRTTTFRSWDSWLAACPFPPTTVKAVGSYNWICRPGDPGQARSRVNPASCLDQRPGARGQALGGYALGNFRYVPPVVARCCHGRILVRPTKKPAITPVRPVGPSGTDALGYPYSGQELPVCGPRSNERLLR